MEIDLRYVDPEHWPRPEGWVAVGLVGHLALAYDPARQPYLVGDGEPIPLEREAVNVALAPAVDRAASKLWPGGWTIQFAQVFAVNRRSLQPDRLARQGLPPDVLRALGEMAGEYEAEGFGWMLMALARFADAYAQASPVAERVEEALQAAERAARALQRARRGKPGFREFNELKAEEAKERGADPSTDTVS